MEWLLPIIKEGGFFALAVLSMVVTIAIYKEYLKLVALVVDMVKASAVADTNLVNTINRLVAVVEARNSGEAQRK